MIYKSYVSALEEKRVWRFFGFHSVVTNNAKGWKVKVIDFVGWEKGVEEIG